MAIRSLLCIACGYSWPGRRDLLLGSAQLLDLIAWFRYARIVLLSAHLQIRTSRFYTAALGTGLEQNIEDHVRRTAIPCASI